MGEKVLVLGGGGSRGAYQVGVLKRLTEEGKSWDKIAGVSVGALNGAFLAQYPKEQQYQGVLDLEEFWLDIEGNQSVYKNWLCREVAALWRGGLYNTSPLKELVCKNISPERLWMSGVELTVGATCLETGEFSLVSYQDPDILDWVLASASFPVAFPPVKIYGKHWVDGGARNVTPLEAVIHDEDGRSGDIILCSPFTREMEQFPEKNTSNALAVALRTSEILVNEVAYTDLDELAKTCGWSMHAPKVEVNKDPLQFSPEQIRDAIAMGHESGY